MGTSTSGCSACLPPGSLEVVRIPRAVIAEEAAEQVSSESLTGACVLGLEQIDVQIENLDDAEQGSHENVVKNDEQGVFTNLFGVKLCTSGGSVVNTEEALCGKAGVALYFSAHWCPPCHRFTPVFAKAYATALREKDLEVVFVSSDRSGEEFEEYFRSMPWLAIPFRDRKRKGILQEMFDVKGIPSVIVLDGEGSLLTADGRTAILKDPKGSNFPDGWKASQHTRSMFSSRGIRTIILMILCTSIFTSLLLLLLVH